MQHIHIEINVNRFIPMNKTALWFQVEKMKHDWTESLRTQLKSKWMTWKIAVGWKWQHPQIIKRFWKTAAHRPTISSSSSSTSSSSSASCKKLPPPPPPSSCTPLPINKQWNRECLPLLSLSHTGRINSVNKESDVYRFLALFLHFSFSFCQLLASFDLTLANYWWP